MTNSAYKVPPAQIMKVRDIKFKTTDLLKEKNVTATLLDKKNKSSTHDKKKALVKTS